MRKEVIELGKLGPLPCSDMAVSKNRPEAIDKYQHLLASIQKPVTDEEARALVTLFGPDDCFGLVWPLVHLVESAPGWPLEDCLKNSDNEWIQLLKLRVENGRRLRSERNSSE
jgi:hypothetical protein